MVDLLKCGHTWPSERPKNMRGLNTLRGKVRTHIVLPGP